jgi:hypothetical protein
MMGGRLWFLLDNLGRVVDRYFFPLDHPDKAFNRFTQPFVGQTIVLADLGFRDANGTPQHLKICKKGTWNERMVVETVFSILTIVCHLKKIQQCANLYFLPLSLCCRHVHCLVRLVSPITP